MTTDENASQSAAAHLVELSDGLRIPPIGLGTAPLNSDDTHHAILTAAAAGYRLFDTGAAYGNESGVGRGLRDAGVPRQELQVITKLRGADHGADATTRAVHESLERLGLDYIDLYLIHWPLPRVDKYVESWETLIQLREQGLIKSLGTSNFLPEHLERLDSETGVLPTVNQVEVHPGFDQLELREWHLEHGVQTMAYSPLGRGTGILDAPVVLELAQRYDVSPAQILLRWHIELRVIPLPRTATPERQRENLDIFTFALDPAEVHALTTAFPHQRVGRDPVTHEEF